MTISRGPGGLWPVPYRSLLGSVLGVPPVAAVGGAAALTGIGVFADLVRIGTLGLVFAVCYVVGCLLAVVWVRRNALFGPMVAPPLLLAVAVPVVVLLAGSPKPGAGVAERLLVIGAPLVNAFPTMAGTTAAVLAIGLARILTQRPADRLAAGGGTAAERVSSRRGSRPERPGSTRTGSGSGAAAAARGAGRTPKSPPRS